MFWKKIESKEYRELYHEIELLKIDIALLQKRKLKKLPLGEEETKETPFNDGMDDLRKLNKEANQH